MNLIKDSFSIAEVM